MISKTCPFCDGACGFESVDDVGELVWYWCDVCNGTGIIWSDDTYDDDPDLYLPEPNDFDDYWR